MTSAFSPARFCHRLVVNQLRLQRGFRLLVDGLDLCVEPGSAFAIQGQNGSGKTTLLRALGGLHRPAAGSIAIEEAGPAREETLAERSFLGHQDPIKSSERLFEQLRFWADIVGAKRERVDEVLNQVGLIHQSGLPGGVLSAGQRRRATLARLLLEARPIWLLDEPAAPLDQEGRTLLGALLDDHRSAGGIVIAAVHDPLPGRPMEILWLGQAAMALAS
ncbi:heme ABC exporter ATP-binding protein CcmA [Candidatus Phycosocius spiralis]|uniref:Cytochrome c biogenesis ATP-binding export protein CcmA n=1 Tax=Candidatus Phycosocius spiralis TaxID=2815099 RepID=A0ABQ4PTL9_9PROT|nr:heme ABC exporter ATP-binding protein CcmA [Candidatus Phycosocius spiralis]GIU66314.1 cytochrome c biogenesis ATP-binding export protein CcmA [Candidatus Phycosocius spiralis]